MIARGVATTVVAQPVVWSMLGYQFEAASMIAGLSACLMLRVWVSLHDRPTRLSAWFVDLTVIAISMMFTAGWIVLHRPSPFYALLTGTGFGALGAGVIAIALAWMRRIEPLISLDGSPASIATQPRSAGRVAGEVSPNADYQHGR